MSFEVQKSLRNFVKMQILIQQVLGGPRFCISNRLSVMPMLLALEVLEDSKAYSGFEIQWVLNVWGQLFLTEEFQLVNMEEIENHHQNTSVKIVLGKVCGQMLKLESKNQMLKFEQKHGICIVSKHLSPSIYCLQRKNTKFTANTPSRDQS